MLTPSDKQINNAIEWLKKVSYKNSTFAVKVDGMGDIKTPVILMKTPIVCVHTGESQYLLSYRNIMQFNLDNEILFSKTMLSLIWQQETHEAMELYKYNNVQAFDPHKPENEYNMTVNWIK